METGHYVNSPVVENRNGGEGRESHSDEFCNRYVNNSTDNFTLMSASNVSGLISERDQLRQDRDRLLKEKDGLLQERDQLLQEKDGLLQERDQLLQEKDGLLQEKDQLLQEKDGLLQEKDQLLQEKDGLLQERDQLLQEKDGLLQERDRLLQERDRLLKENNQLTENRDGQIQDLISKPCEKQKRETLAMASVFPLEDLHCSICLTIFTDPVTLHCGHSFCRKCIIDVVNTQHQCPQCRSGSVSLTPESLQTSHILKHLVEKAKEAEKKKEHGSERAKVAELMCPEHDEKLKLFCVTDQQLACIICRDGERHEGHNFKPIREAAASLRKEMEKGVEYLPADIHAIESHANSQREEITKTKEKSHQLMTQISREFEEMHQFLRKREDEIKKELKHKEDDAVKKMSKNLKAIETTLSESRELEGKVTSALTVTDPERFLKIWTEGNSMTPEDLFRPRADDLMVVNTSLCLGPYASHLQFFMWKEMLQVIQPREEVLSLKSNSANITVCDDGRSLLCTTNQPTKSQWTTTAMPAFGGVIGAKSSVALGFSSAFNQNTMGSFGNASSFGGSASGGSAFGFGQPAVQCEDISLSSTLSTDHVFSVNKFTSGQHYWEIEVGQRNYWELGVKDNFLKYDGQKCTACSPNLDREVVVVEGKPRKIGVYLNCSSMNLSFYNADNMSHIHTMSSDKASMPVSAHFNVTADPNRLTVCWY
ncbi:nuclear factor 7, ovary-like [Scomber japonicus]|uniref:nuclear factor 7, ovary-like n=1 Tax=Scomber japonicus TaxID=13676 RepID=UPI0023051FFC|nr:nuclear factor 7, ovary-like [Scomber japonicus]